MATQISPSDTDVLQEIRLIKELYPEYGIKRVLMEITSRHPDWTISEKRIKKIMQANNLVQHNLLVKSGVEDDASVPVSFVDPKLDIPKLSNCVEAKMIDRVTGKGLFAVRDIKEGEILFEETPFAWFPGWTQFSHARAGEACGLCSKMFILSRSSLSVRCPHCDITYCTKSCRQTAWETFHKLECIKLNPAIKPYLDYCQSDDWSGAMGVERIYSHLILANEKDQLDTVMGHYDAFATVSHERRQELETSWIFMEDQIRAQWKHALDLLSKALNPPPKKAVSKSLPEALSASLFSIETFLNYLGKWNINNQNGGLYLLQSGINHSCIPNVAIDHPAPFSDYKLAVRAIRDAKKGEQIFETYVNPVWGKETRQIALSKYMFECKCQRCINDDELSKEMKKALRVS